MEFSQKVRMARAALDFKQAELAEACNLSEPTIVNLEKGESPSARTIKKLEAGVERLGLRFTDHGVEENYEPIKIVYNYIDVLEDALSVLKKGEEILFHRADDRRSVPEVVQKMNEMRDAGIKFRSTICEGNNFIWGNPEEYRQLKKDYFLGSEVQVIYADRYVIHERKKINDKENHIYWIIKSQQIADVQRKEFQNYWKEAKCL
jgi:transcriptional regulator with XRE-family HTH domain